MGCGRSADGPRERRRHGDVRLRQRGPADERRLLLPGAESHSYDANGNPASAVLDSANRILDDGIYTYTYDAEGNRSTRTNEATGAVDTYSYDQRDRLVGVTTKDASGT